MHSMFACLLVIQHLEHAQGIHGLGTNDLIMSLHLLGLDMPGSVFAWMVTKIVLDYHRVGMSRPSENSDLESIVYTVISRNVSGTQVDTL